MSPETRENTLAELLLQEPMIHEEDALSDASPRKLWRWGRRRGKTRSLLIAGVSGHGPGWPEHPLHEGILQGWDIVWVARDLTQGKAIWWEEIVPRFEPLVGSGVTINHTDHYVRLRGLGSLYLRSNENINSVRGLGARLKGVVIDEGAWFDLKYALTRVIYPILLDNDGWLIVASTTNAGHDGNPMHEVPSYFNQLCTDVQAGKKGPEWKEWYGTAEDNPKFSAAAWRSFTNEYNKESPEFAEEVMALLITAGGGLLFGYLNQEHKSAPGGCRPDTRRVVSADWGWASPAPALWIETDSGFTTLPRSRVYREWWPTETLPQHWAEHVGKLSAEEGVEAVIIDSNTQAKGQDGSPSIFEQMAPTFRKYGIRFVAIEKGPNTIKNSTQLLHTYLFTAGDTMKPILTISEDCPLLWKELTTLRRGNPKERATEDPNIPAPHQSDHGFDALRYWAMSRPRPADLTEAERYQADQAYQKLKADPQSVIQQRLDDVASAKQGQFPKIPIGPQPTPFKRKQPWQR